MGPFSSSPSFRKANPSHEQGEHLASSSRKNRHKPGQPPRLADIDCRRRWWPVRGTSDDDRLNVLPRLSEIARRRRTVKIADCVTSPYRNTPTPVHSCWRDTTSKPYSEVHSRSPVYDAVLDHFGWNFCREQQQARRDDPSTKRAKSQGWRWTCVHDEQQCQPP